ncbi:DUF3833 family protein [Rhizobium sp. YIM 134829]|uniref:DUF3833 family protein n=1 Tax=Rhizobium sp. YIM 134829 TaxID=3390453 RepID=UPI00397BE8FA
MKAFISTAAGLTLSLALAVPVLAATSAPPRPVTTYDKTVMERYFAGSSTASGTFKAITGLRRDLDIRLRGTVRPGGLTLREDIRYKDGQAERKTWRFTRTGPTTYHGTREDVVGGTTVHVNGNTARFTYLVDLDPGPKQSLYRFYDRLTFSPDGRSMTNTATVWKAIFPVASVKIDFKK